MKQQRGLKTAYRVFFAAAVGLGAFILLPLNGRGAGELSSAEVLEEASAGAADVVEVDIVPTEEEVQEIIEKRFGGTRA